MSASHYPTPDYSTLDEALAEIGSGLGASEVHGIICGVLCIPEGVNTEWLAEIIESTDPDANPDACAQLLLAVYASTQEQLASTSFEFVPLLPDDDENLGLRSDALGEWCTGFLFGLTFAGTVSFDCFPDESREVVGDITKFATIRASNSDDDEEEAAFMELVEYIRVGVVLISEELYAAADDSTSPTLH